MQQQLFRYGLLLLRGHIKLPRLLLPLTVSVEVPEYSFLDARGLGAYEGKTLDSVSEVYASDSLSATIKPPPIDDGTPNESVQDVFVRMTHVMSSVETQYSDDTAISVSRFRQLNCASSWFGPSVSPDSDNLTVLQAGLVGLELQRQVGLKGAFLIPFSFSISNACASNVKGLTLHSMHSQESF